MAFATGYLADQNKIGSGELYGSNNICLTAKTFENGLVVGRFAKMDTGSLDNIDASTTPVIAGVVLRFVSNALESGATITTDLYSQVEFLRAGLATVDVVTGDTPSFGGVVYVENQTAGEYGKATTTSAGNVTTAYEFLEEVTTDAWLVRLK